MTSPDVQLHLASGAPPPSKCGAPASVVLYYVSRPRVLRGASRDREANRAESA